MIARIDPEAALAAMVATLKSQLATLRVGPHKGPATIAWVEPIYGSIGKLNESEIDRVLRNMARNLLAVAMADEVEVPADAGCAGAVECSFLSELRRG